MSPGLRGGWRCSLAGVLSLPLVVWAAPVGVDAVAERARIEQARAALEARFVVEQAQCQLRFAVNACLEDARVARRHAEGLLRDQELLLDEADRREKAAVRWQGTAQRQAVVARRQLAAASAAPLAVARQPAVHAAPANALGQDLGGGETMSAQRQGPSAEATAEALQRAAAAERRRSAMAVDQARIAARVAARASEPQVGQPLPAPSRLR